MVGIVGPTPHPANATPKGDRYGERKTEADREGRHARSVPRRRPIRSKDLLRGAPSIDSGNDPGPDDRSLNWRPVSGAARRLLQGRLLAVPASGHLWSRDGEMEQVL